MAYKAWNSTLTRHKGLKSHKRLNPKSDKQREKDALWNGITEEKCYETGFICLWCRQPGQRNDNTRFDYLDGHHTRKPRYKHNKKRFCYPSHRAPCHGEIEDNNIDVEKYPSREAWLKSLEELSKEVGG